MAISKPRSSGDSNKASDDSRPAASYQLSNSLDQFFNANQMKNVQGLQETSVGVISAFFAPAFSDRRNLNSDNLYFLRFKMFSLFKATLEARRSELSPEATQILIDELDRQMRDLESRPEYRNFENVLPSILTGIGIGLGAEAIYRSTKFAVNTLRRPMRPIAVIPEQHLRRGDSTFKRSCKAVARSLTYLGTQAGVRVGIGSLLGVPSYYLFFQSKATYAPIEKVVNEDLRPFLNDLKTSLQ
ncbi:MAG: hypothetical protein J0L93_08705 [Deltaproteobacteria bacterium]|nr:hypothetical protein [Deltaproteobacteria bacterium]